MKYCASESRLATSRFTNKSECFAWIDIESHTVDRFHYPFLGVTADELIDESTTTEIKVDL
jgi:hypothetical protein